MPRTILFLAANPADTVRLRVDIELRAIDEALQRATHRERFTLVSKSAVRPVDIQRALLQYTPQIVHFSGHGAKGEGIFLENEQGNAVLVPEAALSELFALFENVTCVVLNACYSQEQAAAIGQRVPFVVGMSDQISDDDALRFAIAFYDAIGDGRSYYFAFRLGCNAINLAGPAKTQPPTFFAKDNEEAKRQDKELKDEVTKFANETSRNLVEFVKGRQNHRTREEALEQLSLTGLSFIRDLWPLSERVNMPPPSNDANYDFPSNYDSRDEMGTGMVYWLVTGDKAKGPNGSAFDICAQYLSYPRHYVVTGHHQAGKTWLRLYFEWYTLIADPDSLPVFYFAPATLAYQVNHWELVNALASSIANQLLASLLERSANQTTGNDPLGNRRIGIVPFLRQYGYHTPTGNRSLAQPVPADTLVDIGQAYGSGYLGGFYAEMKQAIEQVPVASTTPSSTSIEAMLDDIQRAIELVGYRRVYILVDNWDDLPKASLDRLLRELLDVDLLTQLLNHNIFLKVFSPALDAKTLSHLDEIGEIDRQHDSFRSHLLLYTYR